MDLRRRDLLGGSLGLLASCAPRSTPPPASPSGPPLSAASSAKGSPAQAAPRAMKILILGGTQFLGPEIVASARARGHVLTLFNRGKTNPGLFPDIEKLHGDRKTGDLASLRGRVWDAVVDTSGYVPRAVRTSATELRSSGQYLFVSSISVYDHPSSRGVDESAKVATLDDPTTEKVDEKTYGGLKAACERAAEEVMPGRVTVVRPGLIVGPGDPTDRYTYWPVRLAAGGDVLAPGTPDDPGQVIDARDLGAWIVRALEERHHGIFNAVCPPTGMGTLLGATQRGVGAPAKLTWVDAPFLEKHGVEGWSDLPVWVPPTGEEAGMSRTSSARAIAKGLAFRPLEDTARDTLAWWKTLPEERRTKPKAGLSREKEREVLAAWAARAR